MPDLSADCLLVIKHLETVEQVAKSCEGWKLAANTLSQELHDANREIDRLRTENARLRRENLLRRAA